MSVRSHIAVIEHLDDVDAVAPGLRVPGDSFVDQEHYERARADLVAHERQQRYDSVKLANLSPDEARANEVLGILRSREIADRWDGNDDAYAYAGMGLNEAKARGLEKSELFAIIKKMPKGALLHCHMDGTVDARFLIEKAAETSLMCMSASEPLTSNEALHRAAVQFNVLPSNQTPTEQATSIYSSSYSAASWVPYAVARSTFPFSHLYDHPAPELRASNATTADREKKLWEFLPHLPQPSASHPKESAFDSYVHSLLTLTPHADAHPIKTSAQAWAKFINTFVAARGLLGWEPTYRAYLKEMVKSHARDGVQYIETRLNFLEKTMITTEGSPTLSHADWVRIFIEAISEAKAELASEGVTFFDAKIIYATVRFISNAQLREYLDDCMALKRLYPDTIIGFDLVGHEDPGITLKEYLPELLAFQKRCKEELLDIPFLFHAGETISEGTEADENLYDAILLGTKRIGHGYSLTKHPHLMQLCKEREILIESCPLSNQLLRYTDSVAHHPLPILLNNDVPTSLSNDDPCQFGNFGLSFDFYQLFVSSHSTTLASLGVLARRSIRYARLTDEERRAYLRQWDQHWAAFVRGLVEEHADIMGATV